MYARRIDTIMVRRTKFRWGHTSRADYYFCLAILTSARDARHLL